MPGYALFNGGRKMRFKVDSLPTADELCPFENVCPSAQSPDCPKRWTDEEREELKYERPFCELLIVD